MGIRAAVFAVLIAVVGCATPADLRKLQNRVSDLERGSGKGSNAATGHQARIAILRLPLLRRLRSAMASSLPHELRTGRVVRAVYLRVAVQAGLAQEKTRRHRVGEPAGVVGDARMPRLRVTALAQERRALREHGGLAGAVWRVAGSAVFGDGRVFVLPVDHSHNIRTGERDT